MGLIHAVDVLLVDVLLVHPGRVHARSAQAANGRLSGPGAQPSRVLEVLVRCLVTLVRPIIIGDEERVDAPPSIGLDGDAVPDIWPKWFSLAFLGPVVCAELAAGIAAQCRGLALPWREGLGRRKPAAGIGASPGAVDSPPLVGHMPGPMHQWTGRLARARRQPVGFIARSSSTGSRRARIGFTGSNGTALADRPQRRGAGPAPGPGTATTGRATSRVLRLP
jgi:hypothetical protein